MAKRNKKIVNLIIVVLIITIFSILLPNISMAAAEQDASTTVNNTTDAGEEEEKSEEDNGLMMTIKETVAEWYYIFRYFSIVCMLITLIYLGIKLAISSIAEDKAKYKRMLYDWIVGFVIVFGIHYFMLFVIKINQTCVDFIVDISTDIADELLMDNEMGLQGAGLYETVRTRAYEFRVGIGTSGMIMYMVLIYYTVRFILIYFKRFFALLILTIIAPLMGLSYAFTKINTGKAQILGKWAQEYCLNVFLQTIHALLYGCLVSIALVLSTDSVVGFILAMVMLNFMLKADSIFRKIFKFSGSILESNDNSDIKENMAGLFAAKAGLSAIASNEMVKEAKSAIKRGYGALGNAGLYAGATAYDKMLTSRNKELENKKAESIRKQEAIKDAKTQEEKSKLQKEKDKLDQKIANMEGRRERFKKYKGNNSDYIDKKAEKIIEAEERAAKAELSDERKEEIRKRVEDKYKDKITKRVVERDPRTGRKVVTNSIATHMKMNLNTAIWGNQNVKNETKNMINNVLAGLTGSAMMLVAVPQIVASPKIGMALMAKGMSNAKKLYGDTGYKKVTTYGYRRHMKKNIKQIRKNPEKNQRFTQNRINPKGLETMKYQMKMDMAGNMIRNINAPGIILGAVTLPLKLTGVMGAARRIQADNYRINEAKRELHESLDISFAIETKRSLEQDFESSYNKKVSELEQNRRNELGEQSLEQTIMRHKLETGAMFEVNDRKLEFKNNSMSSLMQTDLIDNIILKVAVNHKVTDLKNLNTNNQFVQLEIIQELGNLGIIANVADIKLEENQKELSKLMEKVSERVETISKENPDAVKEKLTQTVIIEYMEENGIEDPEILESEEHREKIKEIILDRFEEAAVIEKDILLSELDEDTKEEQKQEDLFNSRVEEIVRNAMETTSSPEEMHQVIEDEVQALILEEHEKQDENIFDVQEELGERKKKYSNKPEQIISPKEFTITEDNEKEIEKLEIEALEPEVPEAVAIQTKKIVENVDDIISIINKKDEEKVKEEEFIDSIISAVQVVDEDAPTITKEEKEKLESSEIINEILNVDARRDVRKSLELDKLNKEIRAFAEQEITIDNPQIEDEVIEENLSGDNDQLVAYLLAMKEQDQVAVELRVKPESSEKRKFMKVDDNLEKSTYGRTGIEDLISSLSKNNI